MFFKYEIYITFQTHPTQIVIYFLMNYEKTVFTSFLKIIGVQN